jgi:hypothetical protein
MKPPEARKKSKSQQRKRETGERRRRRENAKKAKEAADVFFPGEKWIPVKDEERIYLSPRRPVGEKSSYKDELRDAQILRDRSGTVYLVPDDSRAPGNKYDAIVNGMKYEFKNMKGASVITLKDHFLRSRMQAPNVFINLEKSPLGKRDIISTLYGVRNGGDYAKKNRFEGGMIVLMIKGHERLIYLNVDALKDD